MPRTEQEKLIFETLHYRPPYEGTCFVVNKPGLRLISSDASFLPAVEAALLEAAQGMLAYIIGVFLVLGTKYAPGTLVPFIRSLPQSFMRKVVANIPTFFRIVRGKYNFDVTPAPELIEFVRDLAQSEDQSASRVAQRALKMMQLSHSQTTPHLPDKASLPVPSPGRLSEFDLSCSGPGVCSAPPHGPPAHGYNAGAWSGGLPGASSGGCSHASLRHAGADADLPKRPAFSSRLERLPFISLRLCRAGIRLHDGILKLRQSWVYRESNPQRA